MHKGAKSYRVTVFCLGFLIIILYGEALQRVEPFAAIGQVVYHVATILHPLQGSPLLPTGTLTHLFTDIEGSSQSWEEFPQAMNDTLAQHDAILREAVESQQGIVIKTTGDGLQAVFNSTAAAIRAAISSQRDLLTQTRVDSGPLLVRMALYTGEAEEAMS